MSPRSATRSVVGRLVGVVAAGALLASCTVSGGDPGGTGTEAGGPDGGEASAPAEPTASPSPQGPSPQELNDQVLAAAAATEEPLASVTAPAGPQQVATVLDVLEVRRVDDGTLVRMRLSSAGEFNVAPNTFASDRFGTQNFVRDVYLDDVAAGVRYLPLQFEDFRTACVCPYIPLVVGAEPQQVDAVFPPLPEGTTTVDLRLAESGLVVEGLPVGG